MKVFWFFFSKKNLLLIACKFLDQILQVSDLIKLQYIDRRRQY